MRGITIRFSDGTYDMLKTEAAHQGIGLTQFIRESALIRCTILRGRRGDISEMDAGLLEAIREFLETERRT